MRPATTTSVAAIAPHRALDVVALTKPRITAMVLLTTAGGLWLAPGASDPGRGLLALLGTVLIVGAANTLNMYWERDSDAFMERTRGRPLPAGRLPATIALWFGITLAVLSVPLLWVGVNLLSAALATVAFGSYVFVYTPLKRKSWIALLVGAVPGAMPPLIGWTAQTGTLDTGGVALFALMFVWQLPHFIAISLYRADEFARAGIHTAPSDLGVPTAKLHLLAYAVALLPVSLWLYPLGLSGPRYAAAAVVLGAGFVIAAALGLRRSAGTRWARGAFLYSLVYLTILFAVLAADAP